MTVRHIDRGPDRTVVLTPAGRWLTQPVAARVRGEQLHAWLRQTAAIQRARTARRLP